MTTDRSKPPPIHTFQKLELLRPRTIHLRNGWKAYLVDKGTQEVVRIEAVFFAGRPYERKRLAARATVQMLKEGAGTYDGNQLSETFDYYGANLLVPYHTDTNNLVLYSLNRHLEVTLPVFASLLATPTFPERELATFIRRNQQSLKEELEKNDVVAYREITERCYGSNHPYGYNSSPEMYEELVVEDLKQHHAHFMQPANGFLLVSGRITKNVESLLDQYLGDLDLGQRPTEPIVSLPAGAPTTKHLPRAGSLQTALRLLRPFHRRDHPDYSGLYVLNTIFGGYFGSRLMENIREEKGYTYHVGTSVDTLRFGGALHLDAEVGNEQVAATLHEIQLEMERLRTELISEEELEMVRNYLMGNFLTMLDGPFNLSEVLLIFLSEGVPFEGFESLVRTVTEIQAEELQRLAQLYLRPEDYWTVTVGP